MSRMYTTTRVSRPSLEWDELPVLGADRTRARCWRWIFAGTCLFWTGVAVLVGVLV